MRRPLVVAAAVIIVAAGVAYFATRGGGGGSPHATTAETTTAAIVQTNLQQTTPVTGTVSYANPVTLDAASGTPANTLTQDQQAVASASANLTADQTALSDTQAGDAQSTAQAQQAATAAQATETSDSTQLAEDQATLTAEQAKEAADCQGDAAGASGGQSPSPCAADAAAVASDEQKVAPDQQKVTSDRAAMDTAQSGVTSAQQKASQSEHQAQAKLTADELSLSAAQSSLSTAQATGTSMDASAAFTSLPTAGQVVDPGQALWSVDGQPTVLLTGSIDAFRAFVPGMSAGTDVTQLDNALAALGFGDGLTPSSTFTSATSAAISRLQASLGAPQTGTLPLGSVVFQPSAIRVTTVHPIVGAAVQGGMPVLDVTSTAPIVNLSVDVSQAYLIKVGDPVSATLSDGSTATGTITGVGSVATSSTTPGNNNGNSNPSATINVTVVLSHASAAGTFDQSPVTVNITNNQANNVLAVPVSALVALAGGGYALEVVDPSGLHHLVGVTTGLFDDQQGLVQVNGSGLAAGMKVVVAS